jgi:L-malate glycosyltransferase
MTTALSAGTDPRVLMVLESAFPLSGGGGAESQVATLGRCLSARRVHCRVVVPMEKRGPQVRHEVVDGLEVERLPYPRVRGLGGVVLLLRLAWLLFRRRRDYDAIHAHIANRMAAVCCVVGPALGKPVVVKITGGHEMEKGVLAAHRHDPVTFMLRRALRRATAIQATSARLAGLAAGQGFDPRRIHRIPNAVDTERFQPGRDGHARRLELGQVGTRLGIFVGRLVREKGLVPFLESWLRVVGRDEPMGLVLVGEGELRGAIARLVGDAGRERQIRLLGARDDVSAWLACADFAVLPSLHEGLSNALLEYMAAGLPVLGSRVSGTEDLVTPGETGWLFDSGDGDGLEGCLRDVARISPGDLAAMGRRARERVRAHAGLSEVAERLVELYRVAEAH